MASPDLPGRSKTQVNTAAVQTVYLSAFYPWPPTKDPARSPRRKSVRCAARDVPPKALACPECGADHLSGWREDADIYGGADLPDGDFDYDEYVRREFGSSYKPAGIRTIWWITAALVLLAIAATSFRVFFYFPF